jgi:hypothetical protein
MMSCGNRAPAVSALRGGVAAGGFEVGGVLGAEVLQLESLMPGGGPGAVESPRGPCPTRYLACRDGRGLRRIDQRSSPCSAGRNLLRSSDLRTLLPERLSP